MPPATIAFVIRPGLAKAGKLPLFVAHRSTHVRTFDSRWRDLFERADVLSEGSVLIEPHGRMWYGSTSLILPSAWGIQPSILAEVADRNVHVRLRALRMALREACVRAPARLGRLMCEIRISSDDERVRIDVDVQAPLIEVRTGSGRAP